MFRRTSQDDRRRMPRRGLRPSLEGLEGRQLLTTGMTAPTTTVLYTSPTPKPTTTATTVYASSTTQATTSGPYRV